MKKQIAVFVCAAGLFYWNSPAAGQVDYFSPENVRKFAEYLLAEGDYLRAAGEFERYYLMVHGQIAEDSLLYQIARCYTLAERPDAARRYYQAILDQRPETRFAEKAALGLGWSYFQQGDYQRSLETSMAGSKRRHESSVALDYLVSLDYLHLRQWDRALETLSGLPVSADTVGVSLTALARQGQELPRRSAFAAGALSAIVPGSGRIYAGRVTDGLYSLFVVGTTGWLAYEGFEDDGVSSTRGWIYGTLCGFFYLGNIYGSVVAVKIHNDRLELNLLNRADDLVKKLID